MSESEHRKMEILCEWFNSQSPEKQVEIIEPHYLEAPVEEQRLAKQTVRDSDES